MDLIVPDHGIAGAHSTRIRLLDVSFAAVQGKLLGSSTAEGVLDYRLPKVTVHWTRRLNDVSLILPFSLIAEEKQDTNDQTRDADLAIFSVVIRIEYKLLEKGGVIEPEHLPHVLGILGYMHAWPYFRADVQWLTTKLGFPALVLPVVLSGEVTDRVLITRDPVKLDDSPTNPSTPAELSSPASSEQQQAANAGPPSPPAQAPKASRPRRKR